MDKRHIPLVNEKPKHRKKSSKKGQPRANHKHIYETVLLHYFTDYHFAEKLIVHPTKVCTICGRISSIDPNPIYYVEKRPPWLLTNVRLTEEALALDKWKAYDFDKFATKL